MPEVAGEALVYQRLASAILAVFIADLLIAAALLHDWRTRGQPHPAYVIGGGVVIILHAALVPLSSTPVWYGVADFLVGFASVSP